MNFVICHYHEIALKGNNRKFFERRLISNIKSFLPKDYFQFIKRISGRIIIKLTEKGLKEKDSIEKKLKNVFGVVNFSFAINCDQNLKVVQKKALSLLKTKEFKSFRITTKRSNKNFEFKSPEVNEKVGSYIVEKMDKKVDLENFDQNLFIEIVQDYAFLYLEKIEGQGGLPVGVSGKGLVLLSGGIDSPVAAYQMMKRGVEVSFVHFHSLPYTKQEAIDKVKRLVQVLTKFQPQLKLYLSPFTETQKEILLNVPAELRVVLYKRMMNKIAERIAGQKYQVLITGESVGQVASQTLENINSIQSAVQKLILRPLIGLDKQEIIERARKIKTLSVSTLPYEDCCSRFVPKHPATKTKVKELERVEKNIKIENLINNAVKNTKLFKFNFKDNE